MLHRLALLLPLALLVACSGGGDDDEVVTATTTTTLVPITATVDWAARTIAIDGDVPFDVNFCDGEAPFLCIVDDGTLLGSVELATFEDHIDDFDVWATDFFAAIAADRKTVCAGYELRPDQVEPAPFGGLDGSIRYGFTSTVGSTTVERVIGFAANDGEHLRLLVANALDDSDTCLHRESELPVDVMDRLEPVLAAVAAGSSF